MIGLAGVWVRTQYVNTVITVQTLGYFGYIFVLELKLSGFFIFGNSAVYKFVSNLNQKYYNLCYQMHMEYHLKISSA